MSDRDHAPRYAQDRPEEPAVDIDARVDRLERLVIQLQREHELTHTLVAHWLGVPCSPVFRRIASGDHETDHLTRLEEGAVLAVQAYAVAIGLDLVEIARTWGQS